MSIISYIKGVSNNLAEVSSAKRLLVELPGVKSNIDESANTQITSFETFVIGNKGQSNIFTFRPVFQNESVAVADSVVATLNGTTTTKAVQIFRASATNVNTVAVTTRAVPVSTLVDSFTTGWTSSNTAKIVATNAATTQFYNTTLDMSSSSLQLALGNNITDTLVSKAVTENWSNVSTFSLYIRATTLLSFSIELFDGVNSATWSFSNTATNVWEQKLFDLNFPAAVVGTLNRAAITRIGFYVNTPGSLVGNTVWIDSLESQLAPGALFLQLYDMGPNIRPSSLNLGTLLTLDDGNTQLQIANSVSKNTQRVPLKYGVSTTNQLKKGNYYALVFDNGGSGIVEIYGNNVANSYSEGNTFTIDSSQILTYIPNSAISFCIFSYKACFIRELIITTDYPPGQARTITFSYSTLTNLREQTLLNNMRFHNQSRIVSSFTDIPVPLHEDDVIVMTYYDDSTSDTTEVQIGINAIYKNFDLYVGREHSEFAGLE